MERTFKFRQDAIVDHVDAASARKVFNLKLDVLGPYSMRYSHNGRCVASMAAAAVGVVCPLAQPLPRRPHAATGGTVYTHTSLPGTLAAPWLTMDLFWVGTC